MSDGAPMKVFEMNDCEWWMARSPEEAAAAYRISYGMASTEILDGPRELSDAELDELRFHDDLGDPNAATRTFREELASRTAGFCTPQFFATTDF